MLVGEIMNKNVNVINFEKTLKDAAKMMADGNFGALPVEKNDKMVGMITDRDIALRALAKDRDPSTTTVETCMTEKIEYCFEDDDVNELVKKMKSSHRRRYPVVNKNKKLVGIVSLRELVTKIDDKDLMSTALEGIFH